MRKCEEKRGVEMEIRGEIRGETKIAIERFVCGGRGGGGGGCEEEGGGEGGQKGGGHWDVRGGGRDGRRAKA
jgi:hypothetical protein